MSEKKKTKEMNKAPFNSPKGTRDITGEKYYEFQGFFEKAQEVAMYYGFKPIETPLLENEAVFTSGIGIGTDVIDKEMYTLKTKGGDQLALRPEGTAGVMRSYIENGMQSLPQPVMLYYYGSFFRHDKPQRGRYREFKSFGLEVLGNEKSIIDALVIKTTLAIIEEAGGKNIKVDINSIGDKECRNGYIRELTNYYKKHLSNLPVIDRERLKTNPLRILDSKEEKTIEINGGAPDALAHLCSGCKKHFKEVLEYLEEMGVEYRLNKNLVRGLSYYTRTVFEITEEDGGEDGSPLTIAAGGRYDYLGKILGAKKDVPAIGVGIGVDRIVESTWYKKLNPRIIKKPKICFIQLGFEAKLKSLNIIEILRKANISIYQTLSKDTIGAQLAIAEKLEIPYAIIFGQKEALDGTVIVRTMANRSQEVIKIAKLPEYIKNLK